LDETLIHCLGTQEECEGKQIDKWVKLQFPGEDEITAGVNIRPHVFECLDRISQHFQMAIFTASDSLYANPVIDLIDPHGKYFAARLYRNNCIQTSEKIRIKDLRVLSNRNLNDVLLVDNAAYSFGH